MAIELQNVSKVFWEKQVLQNFSHVFPEGGADLRDGPLGLRQDHPAVSFCWGWSSRTAAG